MRQSKNCDVISFFIMLLVVSCSSSGGNPKPDNSSKNDSIMNVQLKSLVDFTLHQQIGLELDSFIISNAIENNEIIKKVKATGRSSYYDHEKLSIAGSYKISQILLNCISLKAIHPDVGNVFEIYEKNDTLLTYRMDSLTFLEKNQVYKERRKERIEDYVFRVLKANANHTKVHFGISREEYNRLGEEFQKNFYEGLIGSGAYELAKPIFGRNDIFVGFEIWETKDKTFNTNNIKAKLVKSEQLGYNAHECWRYVYVCELYSMEWFSRYDKFDRKTKKSIKVHWNKWGKIYY